MRPPFSCLRVLTLLPVLALAACGGHRAHTGGATAEHGPGPASDPWRPYIDEAASRFSIPGSWIRAVMAQESGGHQYLGGEPITSSSGAAGLMQILPSTYEKLSARYGLGDDPYDPHDNIMAGAGLIRELYDRYGSPDFLAAYNVGTRRMDAYEKGDEDLPDSTKNYVAAATPMLGGDVPMRGKLAPEGGTEVALAPAAYAEGAAPYGWSVQVGAYPDAGQARLAVTRARGIASDALSNGATMIGVVTHDGGTLFRARVTGLGQAAAENACSRLTDAGMACWAVQPGA
jgi:hypothetical protein